MTLEQSLAAAKIDHMFFTLGLCRQTCILAATALLTSQGFSPTYSKTIATEVADLII